MLEVVVFRAEKYGEPITRILALHGQGETEMPLTRPARGVEAARDALARQSAGALFPAGRAPEAALSGLYLYFGCWDEAHQHADTGETRENYYWHAIVHRQELDAWNAGYWFRKTGPHAIFPALAEMAVELGYGSGEAWDPIAFVDYCGAAHSGSESERIARRVQLAEWQLLFDWSAFPYSSAGSVN